MEKPTYQAPVVDIFEARVECGFAGSTPEPQPTSLSTTHQGFTGEDGAQFN